MKKFNIGKPEKSILEDDIKDTVYHLIRHRMPWLIIGLLGGILTSFIVSNFEKILADDLRLAYFMPIMVYMSDAVGTQTETIYIRHLKKKTSNFLRYLVKETLLGIGLGLIFGIVIGGFAALWLNSQTIGLTVGIAMMINVALAPMLATIIPTILYKEQQDPALGSGPLTTIIQDLISLLVYFYVASIFIF